MIGKIRYFDARKLYGYIGYENRSIYFHYVDAVPTRGNLTKRFILGDEVSFELKTGNFHKGYSKPRATNVVLLNDEIYEPEQNLTGTIVKISEPEFRWGEILYDEERIFFHVSQIEQYDLDNIQLGSEVVFDTVLTGSGSNYVEAANVRLIKTKVLTERYS